MNSELDKKLVEDFPLLYADRYSDKRATAMCWGFACGDGWEPLIRELSEHLEKEIQKYIELYTEDEIEEAKKFYGEYPWWPTASQVKEKYGTLRFYMTKSSDKMEEYINVAERKSARTCEVCGKRGKVYAEGWIITRCAPCRKKEYEG